MSVPSHAAIRSVILAAPNRVTHAPKTVIAAMAVVVAATSVTTIAATTLVPLEADVTTIAAVTHDRREADVTTIATAAHDLREADVTTGSDLRRLHHEADGMTVDPLKITTTGMTCRRVAIHDRYRTGKPKGSSLPHLRQVDNKTTLTDLIILIIGIMTAVVDSVILRRLPGRAMARLRYGVGP